MPLERGMDRSEIKLHFSRWNGTSGERGPFGKLKLGPSFVFTLSHMFSLSAWKKWNTKTGKKGIIGQISKHWRKASEIWEKTGEWALFKSRSERERKEFQRYLRNGWHISSPWNTSAPTLFQVFLSPLQVVPRDKRERNSGSLKDVPYLSRVSPGYSISCRAAAFCFCLKKKKCIFACVSAAAFPIPTPNLLSQRENCCILQSRINNEGTERAWGHAKEMWHKSPVSKIQLSNQIS